MKRIIHACVAAGLTLIVFSSCTNSQSNNTIYANTEDSSQKSMVMETTELIPTEEPTTEEPTTTCESTTEVITESPTTKEETLTQGVWIKYSPQALMYESYKFGNDGIVEKTEYIAENGTVKEYTLTNSHAFLTYLIRGNQILINDKGSREWTWYFTDDDNTLEFVYKDGAGYPNDTKNISQKIYRRDSNPDYQTMMSERKKD